jgi:hypothetical protein
MTIYLTGLKTVRSIRSTIQWMKSTVRQTAGMPDLLLRTFNIKFNSLHMKCFIVSLITLFLFSVKSLAQPVYGEASVFYYTAAGDRGVRNFTIDQLISYKHGDSSAVIDTATKKTTIADHDIVIRAYPNPVLDLLTVEGLNWKNTDRATVKLYDIAGNFLSEKNIDQSKDNLPFSGFPPGTYQVHYYLNNKILAVWKITKL